MDLTLIVGLALPGVIFVALIGTLFWIAARKKRTATDLALRKREALERGDATAAAELDSQLSAIDQRSYWPKPREASATANTPRKNLSRNLIVGGCVLAALNVFNSAPAGGSLRWFDLAVSVIAIIMIVAGFVIQPPWRKD